MYKLVAIDLDGTLLNSYGEISERNRNAIKKATENGIEVVLASGRTISSVESIALDLNANHFLISGNGAIVYDIQKQKIIYNQFLSKQQVLDVIKICEENSIYYNIYTQETIITKSLNYNTLFYHKENINKEEGKRTSINIIQDIYDYVEKSEREDYLKITICDETKSIFNSIIKKLRNINYIDVMDVEHMSKKIIKSGTEDVFIEYFYTEISNKNVNKWSANEFLMQKLNIQKEEVIAIGDNINDKEMIENAGIGAVMQNAAEYVKQIGNIIVSDNNNDGVAEVFENYT